MNNSKFLLTAMVVIYTTFLMMSNTFASEEGYAGDPTEGL